MRKIPHVGVGVVIKKKDKILLLKRKNVHGDGFWSTPGGHLEFGENPFECAIRETKEETGVNIVNVMFLGITNDIFKDDEKHYITIWMKGQYLNGEPEIKADYEMSEVGWFDLSELPEHLFLSFEKLLNGDIYRSSNKNNNIL